MKINQTLLVRLGLLPVIWGLVLAGWFSLGKTILQQALPDFRAGVTQAAEQDGARLDTLARQLDGPAADPRLNAGDDNATALNRRRALYEFGYLNPVGTPYLLTLGGDEIGRPAGAPALELDSAALATTRDAGQDARLVGGALVLLKRHQANPVVVALRLPLTALGGDGARAEMGSDPLAAFADKPKPPPAPAPAAKETPLELLFDNAGAWLAVQPTTGKTRSVAAPDLKVLGWSGGLNSHLTVAAPVTGWPGWWVARVAGVSDLNRTVFMLQLALLGVGVALSVALWLVPAGWFAGRAARPARAVEPVDGVYGGGAGLGSAPRPLAPGNGSTTKRTPPPEITTPKQVLRQVEEKKQREAIHQNDVLQKLQRALRNHGDNETLRSFYQPIFRASDGHPVMHEVLVRLAEPNGDILLPGVFLPVAKQHDLLPQLDAALLNLMLRDHFRLGVPPTTKLALNISSTTFAGMTYMRAMMEQIPPAMMTKLVFEVRSRELLADPSAMAFLRELRDMGAELAVDYFGGGRRMLETSKRLGFDYVKIDAALLWADTDKRRELLGLAKVARSLDLPMVLEKVESQVVEVFARRVGIPYLQGFHFARPAEVPETTPLRGWREAVPQADAAENG